LLSVEANCEGSYLQMEQGNSTTCICTPIPSGLVGNVTSIVTQASSEGEEVRLFLVSDRSGSPYGKYCPPAVRLPDLISMSETHSGNWMNSNVTAIEIHPNLQLLSRGSVIA
jgi:hypothetical protein